MDAKATYQAVLNEVKKHIAGNDETIELMFIALVADGHILLEGVPGVAKTTMTKALASAMDADFKRVQGTPDLQIEEIVGVPYVDESKEVKLKKGPIFANILLIDEMNRMQPKTTTSLLEALEEKQVTIGSETVELPKPFIALATQNPLNIEGTTSLPKVLADRFLMKVGVSYPTMKEEEEMLRIKERESTIKIEKVMTTEQVIELQEEAKKVSAPDSVVDYITKLVEATRSDIHVVMGGSPRAEIAFMRCGKAKALIEGRNEVTIDDIKYLARPVLSHRIVVRSTGGIGVNGVIDGLVATMH